MGRSTRTRSKDNKKPRHNKPLAHQCKEILLQTLKKGLTKAPKHAFGWRNYLTTLFMGVGYSATQIAKLVGRSRSQVYKIAQQCVETGEYDIDYTVGAKKEPVVAKLIESSTYELQYPTLSEVADYLRSKSHNASSQYINRVLNDYGYAFKKPSSLIKVDDPETQKKRVAQCPKLLALLNDPNVYVVFEDEMPASLANLDFERRLAEIGKRSFNLNRTVKRSKNLSCIIFASTDSIMHFVTTYETVKARFFTEVFEKALLQSHNYIQSVPEHSHKQLVFAMDNAPIHKQSFLDAALDEFNQEHGTSATIFKLPPYSPDCNMVESVNSTIKQRLMAERAAKGKFYDDEQFKTWVSGVINKLCQGEGEFAHRLNYVRRWCKALIDHKGNYYLASNHVRAHPKEVVCELPAGSVIDSATNRRKSLRFLHPA